MAFDKKSVICYHVIREVFSGRTLSIKNMFIVKVKAMLPYPKEYEYRIKATGFGTASSRAVREFRKEVKGKRLKSISLQIIKV